MSAGLKKVQVRSFAFCLIHFVSLLTDAYFVTGLTAAGGSRLITDGTVSEDVRQIYIGPARRPFDFAFYAGSRACGSSACIPTARYLQSDNYSSKAPDAKKRGQGEPFDGVQAIGDILGFPA